MMQALRQRQVRLAAMTEQDAQKKLMVGYGYKPRTKQGARRTVLLMLRGP